MSKNDPTEDVLATIARIFEHADAMKTRPPAEPKPVAERIPIVNPFVPKEIARPAPVEARPPQPPQIRVQAPIAEPVPQPAAPIAVEAEPVAPPKAVAAMPPADGYTRIGPGPLEAIRFRWAARADEKAGYFVDETIGHTSRAITSGPMSGEDAIAFIDLQVQEAFERFERLKQSAADLPTHRKTTPAVEPVHAEHDSSEDQGF